MVKQITAQLSMWENHKLLWQGTSNHNRLIPQDTTRIMTAWGESWTNWLTHKREKVAKSRNQSFCPFRTWYTFHVAQLNHVESVKFPNMPLSFEVAISRLFSYWLTMGELCDSDFLLELFPLGGFMSFSSHAEDLGARSRSTDCCLPLPITTLSWSDVSWIVTGLAKGVLK